MNPQAQRLREVRQAYARLLLRGQACFARWFPEHMLARLPGAVRVRQLKRLVAGRLFPPGMNWVQVQDGFGKGLWLEVDLITERSWCRGKHEPAIQQAVRQLTGPGTVFYDVGAHIGSYALPAARAGAQVIAFEPDPENASRLRAHVHRNQLQDGIQVVQAAVWSRHQGNISFRRGLPRSQGGVSWQDHHPILASGEVIEVQVCSLDDFVRSGAPAPNIIKIDVEGAESEVLKGASDVLLTHRPALIVEVHTASELVLVKEILQGPVYDTTWDTPPEGFPLTCFAVPCRTEPKIPSRTTNLRAPKRVVGDRFSSRSLGHTLYLRILDSRK